MSAPDVLGVGLVAGARAFAAGTRALPQRELAAAEGQVWAPGFAEAAAPSAEVGAGPMFEGASARFLIARLSETAIFRVSVKTAPLMFLEAPAVPARDRVWSCGSSAAVEAGAMLVEAGAADRAVYLLEDGELDVVVAADGQEPWLTQMAAGAVFGEQALLDGLPRSASIRAAKPCRGRSLSWESFQRLSAAEPNLAPAGLLDLARVVSERLRRTTEAMSYLRSAQPHARKRRAEGRRRR